MFLLKINHYIFFDNNKIKCYIIMNEICDKCNKTGNEINVCVICETIIVMIVLCMKDMTTNIYVKVVVSV